MPHRCFSSLRVRFEASPRAHSPLIRARVDPARGETHVRRSTVSSLTSRAPRPALFTRDTCLSQRARKLLGYPIDDNNKYGESVHHLPHVRCCDCRLSARWRSVFATVSPPTPSALRPSSAIFPSLHEFSRVFAASRNCRVCSFEYFLDLKK